MVAASTYLAFPAVEAWKPLRPASCRSSATDHLSSCETQSETVPHVPAPASVPVAQPAAATKVASQHVLVVDDEELVGTMLNMMLKRFGCDVRVARTGAEAIDRLRGNEDIALVLLDVRMPGLDGPQTLHIMRTIKPQVPCCFMTGDIGKYSENDLMSHGVLSILKKPFRLQEVAQVLRQAGLASDAMNEPG